jgi:hypothetical protein
LVRWLSKMMLIPFFSEWCKVPLNNHLLKNSLVLWI